MQKERAHNGEHGLICGKHEADDRKAHQAGYHAPAGLTKRPGQPKKARLYYLIPFHNVAYTNHDAIRIFHDVIYIIHDVRQTLSVTTGLLVGVRGFAVTAHAFPFAARHNPPIMPTKSANPPTTSTRNTGTSLFGPRIRRQEGTKPPTTDKHSFALPKAMVYVNEASPKVALDAITPCIPLWQADGYPGPTSKPARSIHTPCESLSNAICNPFRAVLSASGIPLRHGAKKRQGVSHSLPGQCFQ